MATPCIWKATTEAARAHQNSTKEGCCMTVRSADELRGLAGKITTCGPPGGQSGKMIAVEAPSAEANLEIALAKPVFKPGPQPPLQELAGDGDEKEKAD